MKQSNTYVLSLIRSNNVTSNGDIFILPTMFQIAKLHFFLQIQKTKQRKIYYNIFISSIYNPYTRYRCKQKSGRYFSRLANPQRMDLFWSLLLVEQCIHGLCLCGINLSLGSSLGSIYLSLSLCFSSINL